MSRVFTPEQAEAIRLEKKPTALNAGAGSGKTMVLVERYLAALQRGTKPYQLLTVTFTNEAADQLRDRILRELTSRFKPSPELKEQVETTPYIGTIHSFCYRVVDQYGSHLGLPVIEKILSGQEWSEAFDECYAEWLKETGQEKVRALLQHFNSRELRSLAWELFLERDAFRAFQESLKEPVWALVRESYNAFLDKLENRFLSQGSYGFDDLERYALSALQKSEECRQRYREQFRYLLVDEFQDTSRRQWEILSQLVGDEPHKIFVVGDPKQSIYGFRHADVQLFLELSERFAREGGQSLALTTNFRSDPVLLKRINERSAPLFEGSTIPFEPMKSLRDEHGDEAVLICRFEKDGEVAAAVSRVQELLSQGSPPQEVALLFRNSDRLPLYLEALQEAGIAARCDRGDALFKCLDILYLVAYLRALQDPTDHFHFSAFLRSPYIGVGYEKLFELMNKKGDSLWEKARELPELQWLYEHEGKDLQSSLSALFRNTNYWPANEEAFGALLAGLEEEALDLATAIQKINAWEKSEITYERDQEASEVPCVRLMTVHGAKGLEFNHVLLVDTMRQPPRSSPALRFSLEHPPGLRYREKDEIQETENYQKLAEIQKKRDEEEARRILYVALTRARQTLTLLLPSLEMKQPKGSWADLLEPREA